MLDFSSSWTDNKKIINFRLKMNLVPMEMTRAIFIVSFLWLEKILDMKQSCKHPFPLSKSYADGIENPKWITNDTMVDLYKMAISSQDGVTIVKENYLCLCSRFGFSGILQMEPLWVLWRKEVFMGRRCFQVSF